MLSRVELARNAYTRAVADARRSSTPATWRRLVRAGVNLRQARADHDRALAASAPPILVVDDDPDLVQALKDLFAGLGHRVLAAEHVRAAIELLRGGLRPSAIVLDLDLPVMTGWDLRLELLRDPKLRRIPVVALSGSRDGERVPASTSLAKPVNPAALVDAVRTVAHFQRGA